MSAGRKTSQLLDGRAIVVETTQLVELTESSIWSLTMTWRHGIYGTPERHAVTVVLDGTLDDVADLGAETSTMLDAYVVDDGVISPLDEGDERHALLARHIVAVAS